MKKTTKKAKNVWISFFVGTPPRFLITMSVIGLIVVLANPGLLQKGVSRLLTEVTPLLGMGLTVLIVFAGIKMILGGGRK